VTGSGRSPDPVTVRRTTGLVFQIALRQLPKQIFVKRMFYYRFLIFCLALRIEAGAFDWKPRCEEPWTGGQWKEALQRAAAATLNKDPSYVRTAQKPIFDLS